VKEEGRWKISADVIKGIKYEARKRKKWENVKEKMRNCKKKKPGTRSFYSVMLGSSNSCTYISITFCHNSGSNTTPQS
jgi:hypothetical protein